MLKAVADLLPRETREGIDLVARYGGEEFAIILPEIGVSNALTFAEKVRKLIEKTAFKFEDQTIPVTVSIGVAAVGPGIQTALDFIKVADDKLYQAKIEGRNRVCG